MLPGCPPCLFSVVLLRLDLHIVLEDHPDVLVAVDRHEFHHASPESGIEPGNRVLFPEAVDECSERLVAGLLHSYGVRDFFVPCLRPVVTVNQPIVAFLVLFLVECDPCVLRHGVLRHLDQDCHLLLQFRLFLLKVGGIGEELSGEFGIGDYLVLLEVDFDAVVFQLSDGREAVHRVAGETADGLGDDEVDLPGKGIRHHRLETLTVSGVGSRDVDAVKPVMERYTEIRQEIKVKTAERKQLRAEQDSLSFIHVIKHQKLSEQVATLTEDLKELKPEKSMLLNNMGCADDAAFSKFKKDENAEDRAILQMKRERQHKFVQKQRIKPKKKRDIWER